MNKKFYAIMSLALLFSAGFAYYNEKIATSLPESSTRQPANTHEKFLWGAASASFQTEGSPADSDWNRWHREKDHTADGTTADVAADFWNRYHEDIVLAKDMGANTYRLSIAWERIEPQKNVWDEKALDHYEAILVDMQKNGIEPLVTLQHFVLPVWQSQEGGVLAPDFVPEFTAYAKKVVDRLSNAPAHVSYWMTFNEPLSMVNGAYMSGWWPPEKNSGFEGGLKAEANFVLAHIEAVRAIRAMNRPWIKMGIAHAWPALLPKDPNSDADKMTTRYAKWFVEQYIANAMTTGDTHFDTGMHVPDPKADAELTATLTKLNADPNVAKKVDLPGGKSSLDFMGINYYTRDYVQFTPKAPYYKELTGKDPRNVEGWELSPEYIGLSIHESAQYGVPVIITENGTIDPDVEDNGRISFMKTHIDEMWKAKIQGEPVIGYVYWSMTDNFEWGCGLRCHFGLVGIDYASQKRIVRQSYFAFKRIISEHQE